MSEARKTHALATSSGDPPRLRGIVSRQPEQLQRQVFLPVRLNETRAIALQRVS